MTMVKFDINSYYDFNKLLEIITEECFEIIDKNRPKLMIIAKMEKYQAEKIVEQHCFDEFVLVTEVEYENNCGQEG